MEQEESLLVLIEIKLSSEYESENKTSTGSILSLYTLSFLILLPLSLLSSLFLLPLYNIS